MGVIQSFVAFLGRALLSLIFISSSIHMLLDWQGTMQFFHQALSDHLTMSVGSDWMQRLSEWGLDNAFPLLLAGCLFALLGGVMVFLGIWVRIGALLLAIFLLSVTPLFHNFWDLQDPDRQMQMINFMKNLSIFGGVVFLLAVGKGGKRCQGHQGHKDHEKKPA
jgi:putative oxidoreductase